MELDFVRSIRNRKLLVEVDDSGVKIRSVHKEGVNLSFGFDGKYERNKRSYVIYSKPINFIKSCPDHNDDSTITSIKTSNKLACKYSFFAAGNCEGTYDIDMHSEAIHYHDNEAFWHVNTFFQSEQSLIYHARFKDKIDQTICLSVPTINLSNIKNKEQFLNKIKLYSLFS